MNPRQSTVSANAKSVFKIQSIQQYLNFSSHRLQSDGLHMTGCSSIFILLFFPLKYKQIQSINIRHIKLSQLLHMSFQQILYVCDDAPTSLKHGARCHDSSPAWLSLCAVSALTPQLLLSRLKQSRALFWKQRRSLSVPTPVKFTAVHPECLLVVQQV